MKTSWHELFLTDDKPVIADGGMGTMLFAAGLPRGSSPERWNLERPEHVRRIHREYIEAGAQIVLTNTFGGNRLRLKLHGLDRHVTELNEAGARLARTEADAAVPPVLVAGSIGPIGQFLVPLGEVEFEQAVKVFEEQAQALMVGGVDVLWVETMSDLEEVLAAVEGCRRIAHDVPLVTTMTFDTNGRTMMGITPEKAAKSLSELGVVALGGNCGNGPNEIEGVISKMHTANPKVTLVAKANAGLPHLVNEVAVYDATPEVMGAYARRVHAQGAHIIGACCGSTPKHIRAIAEALH